MNELPFTPGEIERAVDALARERIIKREPWDTARLNSIIGRSARPLRSTLQQLSSLGVLRPVIDGRWTLTRAGIEVLEARSAGQWNPLIRLVLRTGQLDREILAFLAEATEEGTEVCLSQTRTHAVAPTLSTIFDWQPEWRYAAGFRIPRDALQAAMNESALEIAEGRPDWVEDRERVGHRAEAYSLRFEREVRGPGAVLHVSRDEGDQFGFDLEDISEYPSRLIECKGSRQENLSFIVSKKELEVARMEPERYEIHFWGRISLDKDPRDEYGHLRHADYPIVIRNLAARIDQKELRLEATSWLISFHN